MGKKYVLDMNRFFYKYRAWIIAALLALSGLFFSFAIDKAFGAEIPPKFAPDIECCDPGFDLIHLVEKGDTLAGISKFYFGKYRYWEWLAGENNLKAEWKDGIPYVWLKPGQVIIIWKNPEWTVEEVANYKVKTKEILVESMFKMVLRPVPSLKEVQLKVRQWFKLENPDNVDDWMDDNRSIRWYIQQLKILKQALGDLERRNIAGEVYDITYLYANPFLPSMNRRFTERELVVAHRKFAIYMISLIDQESDGFPKRGKHRECGIFQIKPRTAMMVHDFKKETYDKVVHTLMNSTLFSIITAVRIVQNAKTSDPHKIAQYYNKGSDKVKYADEVTNRFNRLWRKYGKM